MVLSKIMQDVYSNLEILHKSLSSDRVGGVSEVQRAINRLLALETEFIHQEKIEVDEATFQKIRNMLHHIKSSPQLDTILGVLQAQFYTLLNKIEKNVSDSEKSRSRSVQNVSLDRLDR